MSVVDDGSGPALYVAHDYYLSRWTGAWTQGGGLFDDNVFAVCGYDDNSGAGTKLYAGGPFTSEISSGSVQQIGVLNGSTWQTVGGGLPVTQYPYPPQVSALSVYDDGTGSCLYVAGPFVGQQGYTSGILKWNGTNWSGVGPGGGLAGSGTAPGWAKAMCVFDDGNGPSLFVGGAILTAGGATVNGIAKWDGTSWYPLGTGLTYGAGAGSVLCLKVFDDGTGAQLYVGGTFDHAGGVVANGIARWDGNYWSALPGVAPAPPQYQIRALEVHDDGNGPALYMGPNGGLTPSQAHGIQCWNGSVWSTLGGGGVLLNALKSFDDGQGLGPALYAGGIIFTVGGNVAVSDLARWYGGCTHTIDPLCFGDGTFAPCPCANYGSSQRGCANSASAQGALLSYTGSTVPDTLVLHTSSEPATSLSLFLQGGTQRPVQAFLGDGILCLGNQILRLYAKTASGGAAQAPGTGDPSITQRSATLGDPLGAGSVRLYQVWYRDGVPGFCSQSVPSSFNITNALRVVW